MQLSEGKVAWDWVAVKPLSCVIGKRETGSRRRPEVSQNAFCPTFGPFMPSHLLGSRALLCSPGWPKLCILSQLPKFWDHMPDCVGHLIYFILVY